MGLRTNVDLTVQFGQDNALSDLIFDRDMQSVLDTLEHGVAHAITLAGGETNFQVPFGDVEQARIIYIESDAEILVTLGGGLATKAQVDAAGGSYPTSFLGTETLTIKIDGITILTAFLIGDQTVQQIINRINAAAALLSLATVAFLNGSQLRLKSLTTGTGSTVEIVSASAGVLTTLGLTVGVTTGVNATPATSPIALKRPADTSSATAAQGVPAFLLMSAQTASITIDNVSATNDTKVRIAIAGDLSPADPC